MASGTEQMVPRCARSATDVQRVADVASLLKGSAKQVREHSEGRPPGKAIAARRPGRIPGLAFTGRFVSEWLAWRANRHCVQWCHGCRTPGSQVCLTQDARFELIVPGRADGPAGQ